MNFDVYYVKILYIIGSDLIKYTSILNIQKIYIFDFNVCTNFLIILREDETKLSSDGQWKFLGAELLYESLCL